MACLVKTSAAMDDDLRRQTLAFTAGKGGLPDRANRHMNAPAWLVDEPVQFGCSVIAERGSGATAEDSSPQHRHPRGLAGEGGIYTPVEGLPAPDVQLWVSNPATVARLG
jgi:hypothetical protein